MPRFTIRDLLWLMVMVVVVLSLGLWLEHRHGRELEHRHASELDEHRHPRDLEEHGRERELEEQLQRAWWHYGPGGRTGQSEEVDWSVLGAEYENAQDN